MLKIGDTFDGKYKILEEIGRGGMSLVYLARNERVNKAWAIKEIPKRGLLEDLASGRSLLAEVEMLRRLDHPNIVRIVDVVEDEESIYIVMDYVQGQDLLSVVRANGAIRPETVIRWMKQLCDVLWYLHSRQPPVIYRDMKPANVMLRPDGDVVVIDFGTARVSRGGGDGDTSWLGTRGYAAPEQFGGRGETDVRTDIYALGATMYHLLTGRSPADTDFIIYPLGELLPELKGSGIERIVAKCCEMRRENRYQSAAELLDALEHVHDLDQEVRQRDRRRLRLFFVPVLICLIGSLVMAGFLEAGKRTVENTFEISLHRARKAETFPEAFREIQRALRMRPEDPEGYGTALEKIVSETDRDFTADDRKLLRELLRTAPAAGGEKSCLEIFEQERPADYDRFRFRLGVMYFQYFRAGSYPYAAAELRGLDGSRYLGGREKKLAAGLYLISCAVSANSSGEGSSKVFGETGVMGWTEALAEFEELLGDPEQAGEQCGNTGAAFAMYRTFANLVENKIKDFRDAGAEKDRLLGILDAGERYVRKETGGETDRVVRREAEEAVERARMTVRGAYAGDE